jgi:hypothetical protein
VLLARLAAARSIASLASASISVRSALLRSQCREESIAASDAESGVNACPADAAMRGGALAIAMKGRTFRCDVMRCIAVAAAARQGG